MRGGDASGSGQAPLQPPNTAEVRFAAASFKPLQPLLPAPTHLLLRVIHAHLDDLRQAGDASLLRQAVFREGGASTLMPVAAPHLVSVCELGAPAARGHPAAAAVGRGGGGVEGTRRRLDAWFDRARQDADRCRHASYAGTGAERAQRACGRHVCCACGCPPVHPLVPHAAHGEGPAAVALWRLHVQERGQSGRRTLRLPRAGCGRCTELLAVHSPP
jgi:hypothetical protein